MTAASDADRAKAAEVLRPVGFVFDRTQAEDRVAAALTAARAEARRDQQLWDRRRVEDYAETVHVELTPGDDLGDAVNELYLAARAEGEADRADLLHQLRMLTAERDNLDQQLASALTAESAADQRWTTALRALAEEWDGEDDWNEIAPSTAAARLRAVVADTGKPDTSSEEETA